MKIKGKYFLMLSQTLSEPYKSKKCTVNVDLVKTQNTPFNFVFK